jgi:Holliday junction DNA helicase RuvA
VARADGAAVGGGCRENGGPPVIASVRGEVTAVDLDHAVVEVGGVGLAVRATPATLAALRRGEQASLATALVVREDSLTLYGFADAEARELFTLLQTVSGVGPRLAMAMLAVLEPDTLRTALAGGDVAVLTQVPGIGRKGAERLVIELRDKVTAPRGAPGPAAATAAPGGRLRDQVVEALVGLGFAARAAEQAVDAVLTAGPAAAGPAPGDAGAGSKVAAGSVAADTAMVLRSALARLGRGR